MTRKAVFIGAIAGAVLIVGGIASASSSKSSTATASVPAAPLTVTETKTAPLTVTETKTAPPAGPVSTTVTRVIDGDTVETTDTAGAVLTVRIIGIDAPEMNTCEGPPAAEAMSAIALNHSVTLQMGGDGEDLDKYGRSLRYVDLSNTSTDAGLTLIQRGHAIARYDSRDGYGKHTREAAYIAADAVAPNYSCAAPEATQAPETVPDVTTGSNDDDDTDAHVAPAPAPEHEPRSAPDPAPSAYYANCDAVRAAGAAPLHVGSPGYSTKLDRDKDGVACE